MYTGQDPRYPPAIKLSQFRTLYYPVVFVPQYPMKDKRKIPVEPKKNIMFSSRYKTEICRQFEELGHCEYGDRCLFAHGYFELRQLPNRHPKHKTEVCTAYENQGYCSFGPRCSFVHKKQDLETLIRKMQSKSSLALPMPENLNYERCNGIGDCKQANNNQSVDQMVHYLRFDGIIEEPRNHRKRLDTFVRIAPNQVQSYQFKDAIQSSS